MKNIKKVNIDGLMEYTEYYEEVCKKLNSENERYNDLEKKERVIINKLIESGDLLKEKIKKRKEQKNTSDYKKIAQEKSECKRNKYLLELEKKVLKHNLENFLELKVMEAIAVNWDKLKGTPYHYKKYSNVINDSIEWTKLGYKVHYSDYNKSFVINNYYNQETKKTERRKIDAYIYTWSDNYDRIDVFNKVYIIATLQSIKNDIKKYESKIQALMDLKKEYEKNRNYIALDIENETIKNDLLELNAWGVYETSL